MITAVDTNILLDVLVPGEVHGDQSERLLGEALGAGAVIVSEPVYAELAARFSDPQHLDGFLDETGIARKPCGSAALFQAGTRWIEYVRRRSSTLACPRCGAKQQVRCEQCGANLQPRQHVVADFIIGAHALAHADRLLSRDRGFYSSYFPDLALD